MSTTETSTTDHEHDDECIHIPGLPKSQCTICNGKEKAERKGVVRNGRDKFRV